jgi:hypothetical protein
MEILYFIIYLWVFSSGGIFHLVPIVDANYHSLYRTVSGAYTSLLAADNYFTNVTWKVAHKPRFHWIHIVFQHVPQPRITLRILMTLVARPDRDIFKTIFGAIQHLLSTVKVVICFSCNTDIHTVHMQAQS